MRSFARIAAAATITILSVSLIVTSISHGRTIAKQGEVITTQQGAIDAQQGAIDALKRQIAAEQRLSAVATDLAQQRGLLIDRYRSDAVPFALPGVPDRIYGDPATPQAR